MAALYCQGTIRGVDSDKFDAEDAATRLHNAMKGLGTDELQIIKVLTEHNNAQRQEIKKAYTKLFKTEKKSGDLVEDLRSDLAGPFESLCLYLLMPASFFDAFCLHKALDRVLPGTKETYLTDILVSRSNKEIECIKEEYVKLFGEKLETDIVCDTSGDFENILEALMKGIRKDDQDVDEELVEEDTKKLYNGGEGMKRGTNENVFITILVERSIGHLQKVFKAYEKYAEKDIETSISSEFSLDTEKALLAIVQYIKDPLKFYAKCLFDSMDGPGTDDERLMMLMVSHSEVDLEDIAKIYEQEYKATLAKHIEDDTKGDYRKLLLRILNPVKL